MSTCFLNGEYLPLEDAGVSVLDRGFLFGDAIYEVIPVRFGRLFASEEHVERLGRSLAAIDLRNPYDEAVWQEILERLIAASEGPIGSVYVQVSRGVDVERDHLWNERVAPTVLAMVRTGTVPSSLEAIAAVTSDDPRWSRCDIKSTSLLANVLLRNEARARNAREAILIRDGCVTEGAASNVFVVSAGTVRTPPLSHLILPGVTRKLLLDVLREAGIPAVEGTVSEQQLRDADEIWITSSTRDLLTVESLDGVDVGSDAHSYPVARAAHDAFQAYVRKRVDALSERNGVSGA